MSTPAPPLARRLGLGDAIWIGLASMIGAGVFAALAPAAAVAGDALLIGLVIAAAVAWANASSTAQLAARYPEAGGVYRFGRERLGEWPGFLAGWGFVVGKTASCAAMAMTFAAYVAPAGWERPLAIAAVAVLSGVNLLGITRTARTAAVIVAVVLAVLALVVVAGTVTVAPTGSGSGAGPAVGHLGEGWPPPVGWLGVLQSAGLLFFAFAGYARIATLGEEVRDPARTIPRAIGIALAIVVGVYAIVSLVALSAIGASELAASHAPLADVAASSGWEWTRPIVQSGAALAALGALLALIAGIGRTALAMARDRELPAALAAVHPRSHAPWVAEVVVAIAIIVLVAATDLRGAIGFSSFGVLVYYLVANAAAFTQPVAERRMPRWASAAGAAGCVVLVATLPAASVIGGLVVFALGVVSRLATSRYRGGPRLTP
ncbi:amino acid permease [Agromyces intestinalis]|uniref:Amino acid permease n=1 Tax=Agromyces intestinalis TaxID=2592652 RepID=A0A5C1YGI3_9MICO|nr:APC family permease [Agromyces intestinalis]QEO15274.1 amino acid permease [Agromyces intestinalis]